MNLRAAFAGCMALLAIGSCLRAAEPSQGAEFFEKHIRPILAERCYKCHSSQARKLKAGLYLDSKQGMLKGGDSGPSIVPGDVEKSLLIKAIRYTDQDLQMPPKEPLSKAQLKDFEAWVRMGAPDPRVGAQAKAAPAFDYAQARQFWSFQPIRDPAIPTVRHPQWVWNPIDAFIVREYEEKNLTPVHLADKRTLIRRATYDLTGLPPTPEEVDAFVNDPSPTAFERVVDRLLASRAYGEKWGRHWLDLVRYADTSGCNSDFPIPAAYRYRDWVISAINADMPYNHFLTEQLAGDLLPSQTRQEHLSNCIATGYLAISRRFGSRNAEFHLTIEDTIDNVGKVMLGLSVSCARCHNHKFDPIPTTDYYALYGIFRSTTYAFPGTEIYRHSRDFTLLVPENQVPQIRQTEQRLTVLPDIIERLQGELNVATVRQKNFKEKGAPIPAGTRSLLEIKADLAEAQQELRKLELKPVVTDKAYAVFDGTPADAKVQKKGDPHMEGDLVPRGFLQVLGGQKLDSAIAQKTSGRLQLAQWITDPANPLAARVMANRIWQYHFGKGIVQTPNDFGARGKLPTHPELLDYLASRFRENGWSLKQMHRLIMLSRTYQLASDDYAADSATDVNNDDLWRFNPRRLSAEEIRDSMLFVSGALDTSPAGPHPFPPENEFHYTQHKPFYGDYPSYHRSVYLMQQRIRKNPYLEVFDGADTNATTDVRAINITPIQALYILNDPFCHELADKFAVRVGMAVSDQDQRIDYMYRLAYGRHAQADELEMGRAYLADMRQKMKSAGLPWDQQPRAALASYARMIYGSNEFFFLD